MEVAVKIVFSLPLVSLKSSVSLKENFDRNKDYVITLAYDLLYQRLI